MGDGENNYQSSFLNGSNSSNNEESNYSNALCIYTPSKTTPSPTPLQMINPNADEVQPIPCNIPRPRGRPRGSKNKRTLIEERTPGMAPFYLRIPSGSEVVTEVCNFATSKNIGLTILSGTGLVSNIVFDELVPSTKTFPGPFRMVSLTGTFSPLTVRSPEFVSCYFAITITGTQGEILGGVINGNVTAVSEVVLMAVAFKEPRVYNLPAVTEEEIFPATPSGSEGVNVENQYPPAETVSASQTLDSTAIAENPKTWEPLAFQPPHSY